ncbi:hypothetical protein F511_36015 [Dorcoceras hygrometricum]|uniref:Aminotransferase-like plant mobile domain-containing protein n=1 Tax=Dorcoceras hygrometricum TaxID=472368 RepID=A0A2Z7C8P5_9LAMI|nr:hypothetical protein F511_36015 [Dorcoceras hygrometricum]
MSPKKRGKIPKHSRASPAKSLGFLSRIPWPTTVESPASPFLISCISRLSLAHCASITMRRFFEPSAFDCCSPRRSSGLRKLLFLLQPFRCSSTLRSEAMVSPPVEVIGPIDHPSYFDNAFPTAIQNLLFPVHSRSNSDLLLSQSLFPHAVPAQFKSWPRVSAKWVDWVDRLHPRFGLPLIGPDSPYLLDDPSAPQLAPLRYCFPSYRAVVKQYETSFDEPSVTEHIMFLWVLVCQYVCCPISGKPSAEYLPLACSLSTVKVYNLAAMLLGSFYQGMNSCVANNPLSRLGFLIVDCIGCRPSFAAKANVGWSFEFYNPAIFSRQYGLSQVIPHSVLYYPLDILHLGSEIESGRFSKATVELSSTVPSLFLNPIHIYAPEDVSSFIAWWPPRCAVLAPAFSYPSGKKPAASVGKSVEPSSAEVKAKKRKISSAPSRPPQRSRGWKYSTRSSSRLVSHFSNTDADPIDLVSSSPISDEGEGDGEGDSTPHVSPPAYEDEPIDDHFLQGQDAGLAPESDPPSIPLLQELEGPSSDVDLSFVDVEASTPSQLAKSFPSAESHSYARTAVRNFLELGLHQLGESQRLDMISAVSILKASPEISSEHHLLDRIATIFSDSDAAQTRLTSLMAKREDFHNKRRRAEVMEQENLYVRDQIRHLTVEYDAKKAK